MRDSNLSRLLTLFDEAADLGRAERDAFVARVARDDASLGHELRRMLDADARADEALSSVIHAGAAATVREAPPLVVGDRIGSYELLEVIGQGGMGTVFRARKARHPDRDVAIKVIRPGIDSTELLRRFEREQRVLETLDHDGISRIRSSGSTKDGLPYFIMEFVPSQPLDAYCASATASLRTRLALVAATCRIVAHAHAHDILHRDLKPSNILVTERDRRVRPVVIDFGVARALDPEGYDEPLTYAGRSPGTPAYMSPEQRYGHSRDLDGRADVFSLGVVLFELLTGTLPEGELRPSAKVMAQGAAAQELADQCATSLDTLLATLSGTLDPVVQRALEPDATRRYASMEQFAATIERVLEGRAV